MRWLFVDDRPQEAAGLAAALNDGPGDLRVEVVEPSQAREQVLSGAIAPAGMLIDVELSSIQGERGSGPGIAQDVRVAQKAGRITEFPLVRYAFRGRVLENIGTDPASDDLFDLKLEKDDTGNRAPQIRTLLHGVIEVYERLRQWDGVSEEQWRLLLGLSADAARDWCHASLLGRMSASKRAGLHVAAGAYLRSLLLTDGLLVDEELLSVRLGVDRQRSAGEWHALLGRLEGVRYSGVGSEQFPRWWAYGLAIWWLDERRSDESLVSFSAAERVEFLNEKFGAHLVPLQMPVGSPGDRPWSRCALAAEGVPPRFVPVDPMEAVRLRSTDDFPPWVDPKFASLREALRVRTDPRLEARELARLEAKWDPR